MPGQSATEGRLLALYLIPLGDDIVGANPLQEAGNVDLLGRPHPAAKLRTKATINILKYPAINLLST
jgi:hypothetical protein